LNSQRRAHPQSFLFVPADRASTLLPKAVRSGGHAVIVDPEAGVISATREHSRRDLAGAVKKDPSVQMFVRVNPVSSREFEADLDAVASLPLDGLVIPKCNSASDVTYAISAWSAMASQPIAILAMLESASGVLEASAIARADAGVLGLILGAEDLAAETGMRRTPRGEELLLARSMLVLAATAAGCWAIDTPSLDIDDVHAVGLDARLAADLGFTGKLAIHPRQITEIHAAFQPRNDDVTAAAQVVAAADSAHIDGFGVLAHKGRMVDRPVVEAARRLLEATAQGKDRGHDV
jgi:citrate lyase subunit beta/citryl-CoA lyase